MTLAPSDVRVRSVRGSTDRIVKTPVSRSPYSDEKPPVVSSRLPTAFESMIESAPPTKSLRWNGSTSSNPSSVAYSSSLEPPRT